MKKVAIVFYSATGNTSEMATSVMKGAQEAGAQARLIHSELFSASMLDSFDAVAFGCPARGVEELEEEYFEPMFSSLEEKLKNKRIGLFGSYGWGDGEWMITWQARALAQGATLVVPPVIAYEEPDREALLACKALGAALAE